MVVEPGPHFSVADVCRGWVKGFAQNGCDVLSLNLNDRLTFYSAALMERNGTVERALGELDAIRFASKGIEVGCYEFWPDVVVIVSAFYVSTFTFELLRLRGHKVVALFTESPYEDDQQIKAADLADVVVLNDPTNIDRFRERNSRTVYIPHAYDPDIHRRRPHEPGLASDFCFVGTGYPSRVDFFEQVDWDGIDVALAGNWHMIPDESPLRDFIAHHPDDCLENADAARLYSNTKMSANLYRREANEPGLDQGWAMGPREVELAAIGTPFLRDRRGESDEVLAMLPTFDGPGDFGDKLRYYLAHDDEREEMGLKAQAAVADRTFENNAAQLLRLLDF
jgi:spore maturation protein CgeB